METTIKHMFLSDKRYDTILNSIRITYPNSCIIEIKEIINDERNITFLRNFENELRLKENTKIIELFHGTDEDSSYNIANKGFLMSYNTVSAFGKGTYFSNSASISKTYAVSKGRNKNQSNLLYVIIASVIISDMKLGVGGLLNLNNEGCSCFVNSLENPSYFCIPHDNRALPKYIVSFYEQ